MEIEVEFHDIYRIENIGLLVLVLKEVKGKRTVVIDITLECYQYITCLVDKIELPNIQLQGMTHAEIIALAEHVKKVVVTDLTTDLLLAEFGADEKFRASVWIQRGKRSSPINNVCAPDAIVLALTRGRPLYVEEAVFDKIKTLYGKSTEDKGEKKKKTLEDMEPEGNA